LQSGVGLQLSNAKAEATPIFNSNIPNQSGEDNRVSNNAK